MNYQNNTIRIVEQQELLKGKGSFAKMIDTSDYPQGIYTVSFILPFETKTQRLVKQWCSFPYLGDLSIA